MIRLSLVTFSVVVVGLHINKSEMMFEMSTLTSLWSSNLFCCTIIIWYNVAIYQLPAEQSHINLHTNENFWSKADIWLLRTSVWATLRASIISNYCTSSIKLPTCRAANLMNKHHAIHFNWVVFTEVCESSQGSIKFLRLIMSSHSRKFRLTLLIMIDPLWVGVVLGRRFALFL